MKKGKLMKAAALFLALMVCFTVLSRAADQMSIAVVTTERPQNMAISHEIKAAGRVVQNQDVAVTTLTDQRVSAIYVSEGDRVAKGDVLFEVDTELLDEKILFQQQELEKQDLQVEDARSQKEVSSMQKANEQAQASEQYALSTKQAGVQLERAKTQLSDAKKALKAFRGKKGTAGPEGSVEDALEAALEEKTEAYLQAQQELTSLEWKIENAVNTALQNAEMQSADLQKAGSALSKSPQDEIRNESIADGTASGAGSEDIAVEEMLAAEAAAGESPEDSVILEGSPQDYMLPAGNDPGNITDGEKPESDITAEDTTPDDITIEEILPDNGGIDEILPEGDTGNYAGGLPGGAGMSQTGQTAGSQNPETPRKNPEEIEKSVRDSYQQELSAARQKADKALKEKESAQSALSQYQQEYLAAAGTSEAEQEAQLIANVKSAQEAYVDASLAVNEAAVTGGRAIQSAGIPDASNSTDRMYEISYEQMELELTKLQQLRENDGKITAPTDGLVTKLGISTGEKTVDGPAVVMADLSKGYRFVADITKEQQKYIGAGDLVTLTGSGKNQKFEELAVESVTADEADDSVYHVKIQLPEDTLELGASATMDFSKKSEAYPVTVPLSALHLDGMNQYYVLVTEEFDSIMGTEVKARKVPVTVQEKNDSYAGLAEGVLSGQQAVITGSDKAVDDGSRVRIQE